MQEGLAPLVDNLVRVFHRDYFDQTWSFYDPRPEFAELNTLSDLTPGRYYWILVRNSVSFRQNLKTHHLTCRHGNCWNRIVW